jgi:predicted  nucleic acid-binding Zn-ribbon protein
MAEAVKEIEKRIKALRTKVGQKKKEGSASEKGPTLRDLKKSLKRAQRRRRALLTFEKKLQEKKGKSEKEAKSESPKTEEKAG